ncbi:TRAFAC clade GTPase domain-containing protein [Gloeobacter violaceus]|uniref:Glr3674 protein n=1 Tax=Gloeobacter violaceus (strain ATCC 29082 / PCC 7421) TaxID=251221 RepID=Q7NF52_GLOVI|nr:hypothetical protein [Gloeobacter violaceus]BAC91615.1 glr3674 [Gloeobacter violaceus PCC 7421]
MLSEETTGAFNLLSLGQRGVGKTVFLAGSYAELHACHPSQAKLPLWFDCKDYQSQENIEKVLGYIVRNGQYPPGTMKITHFDFSLMRQGLWGPSAVCDFRLRDMPGEACHNANPAFREIVLTSHGCCVCIDGQALVHSHTYLDDLRDLIVQVMAIATLVQLNRLKYAFALVITKCDLIADGTTGEQPSQRERQRIERRLQALTEPLDEMGARYRLFYSAIPLVNRGGDIGLAPSGGAAPLLWLVGELSRAHNAGAVGQLMRQLRQLLPGRFQRRQRAGKSPLHRLLQTDAPPNP